MTEWKKWAPGDVLRAGDFILTGDYCGSAACWQMWVIGNARSVDEEGYGTDTGCGCCCGPTGAVAYWWRPTPPEEPPYEE